MDLNTSRKRAPLRRIAWMLSGAMLGSCGGGTAGSSGGKTQDAKTDWSTVERPTQPMTLDEARQYVLALVNRDRQKHDLAPVRWDDTAADAGQKHAEDMAAHGFTAHYGSDGSVPEMRYTAAGGKGMAMENAGCFADGTPRELDPDARFTAEALERVEKAFMDEVPPHDGHRKNILTRQHTSLGVGLAQPKGLAIACMAQEFVDDYGDFDDLPKMAKVGSKVTVRGTIRAPAKFGGVALARIDHPKPLTAKALLETGSYAIPAPTPDKTYFPKGFKTKIPVDVRGNDFEITFPLSIQDRAGVYEVSVWAKFPPSNELLMVSLRTITVD